MSLGLAVLVNVSQQLQRHSALGLLVSFNFFSFESLCVCKVEDNYEVLLTQRGT